MDETNSEQQVSSEHVHVVSGAHHCQFVVDLRPVLQFGTAVAAFPTLVFLASAVS